ncbi:hypothetical protein J1N10_15895 [Carboxylicivirga sp. A043]|uniref:hypothetical protein n=1 Tax=Carboxylicivirga litoralis TaxID=2816963 RepID=UPI0021CB47F7|nr:hypothetical protein [Carboxylicivirga sp. A043]MCU4157460.1 hypothetical protein [Carboxylicivirga sp. A043]
MKRKSIKYILISLVSFLLLWGCEEFFRRKIGGFAGSYPYVEYWKINASEAEVIDAIKTLNKNNPNFQPPKHIKFISERDTGYKWHSREMQEYLDKLKIDSLTPLPEKNYNNYHYDYWLHINLYYPDTKETVRTWTRPDFDTTITTFAFHSLGKDNLPSDFRLINKDFWYLENRKQIKKFRRTFVDKINREIENKKAAHNN